MKKIEVKAIKVSKHKIEEDNTVVFFSNPSERCEEVCHVCGKFITYYVETNNNDEYTRLKLNKDYFESWNDVRVEDTVYHTCSTECKEIFTLTPFTS